MPDAGRIVAGTARGIRLRAAGPATRPMADRVKQTAFGILDAGTMGPWPTPFLDVFAGAGGGGLEALSRGAPRAAFLERDRRALAAIRANLVACGFAERAVILDGDAVATLKAKPTSSMPRPRMGRSSIPAGGCATAGAMRASMVLPLVPYRSATP